MFTFLFTFFFSFINSQPRLWEFKAVIYTLTFLALFVKDDVTVDVIEGVTMLFLCLDIHTFNVEDDWKCKLPYVHSCPSLGWFVGRSVGRSVGRPVCHKLAGSQTSMFLTEDLLCQ